MRYGRALHRRYGRALPSGITTHVVETARAAYLRARRLGDPPRDAFNVARQAVAQLPGVGAKSWGIAGYVRDQEA